MKFDARQTISRDLLTQLASASNRELDDLLRSIDNELTVPLRLDAANPATRVITIGSGTIVTNSLSTRNRSVPLINAIYPSYNSGETITFPAASGGTVTFSNGNNIVLTVSANNYIRGTVYLDISNKLNIIFGVQNVVESSATVMKSPNNTLPIGFITLFNNAGTIDNITQSKVYQFGTGSGAGGQGDASSDLSRLEERLNLSLYQYVTPNVSSQDEDDKLDVSSTATYDISEQMFKFTNLGDVLVSTQSLDPEFLSDEDELVDIDTVELYSIWDLTDIDTLATYEVSRDGGNEYQTMTMSRIGLSDVYRGSLTFAAEATYGYSQNLNAAAAQVTELNAINSFSQIFTLTDATKIKRVTFTVTTKNGSPSGYLFAKIVKDNAGSPSTDSNDIMGESNLVAVSDIVAGTVNINLDALCIAGSYHVILYADATYKAAFVTGVTSLVFQTNVAASFTTPKVTVNGRELDLRVRITSGAALKYLRAYGIYYKFQNGVSGQNLFKEVYSFNGTTNQSTFTVNSFMPDADLLMVYVRGTGQVFRYGDFSLQGSSVIFPANTFNLPGQTITLEFFQFTGKNDNATTMADALLTANRLGSTDGTIDKSVAGYGLFLRRPDGTLREITIDNLDNIIIYSV